MPKTFEFRNRPVIVILIILGILVGILVYYYTVAFSSFKKTTASEIHDDILQGLSGLGSVAIAVIIFRIQSLENRNQSLEQATLNYISQTFGFTYPEWTRSLETDIRNQTLTNKYYMNVPLKSKELVFEEKDRQQKRLEEALDLHTRIRQTIKRIRTDIFSCAVFLIMPLLLSLILLTVSDVIDIFWTFVSVSVVVLMSALGIMLLIKMVLGSTVKEAQ
jgi:hypothetical protein